MSTKFFTNQESNTLLQKLEGIFTHTSVHFFDALVGYFRSSGYFRIRPYLNEVAQVRVLVGIDVDSLAQKYQQKGLEIRFENDEIRERTLKDLKKDVQTADYGADVERGVKCFVEDIISGKLQLKIHPSRNIHAKIYIFRQEHEHTHQGWGAVITGSSNLTELGLEKNFEFNVELRDYDDVKFASTTFDRLWEEGINLTEDHVAPLIKDTYLKEDVTPFDLYIKFLIEHFGSSVDYDPDAPGDLPSGFKRLAYQMDAVNAGFQKLKDHNGFFLSDVVGLGKTIVALLIARRFQFYNGSQTRVLVICPPALRDGWWETIDRFRMTNIDVVTSGSLHKINGVYPYRRPEEYDLVIVDEAHKFRSDVTGGYEELQKLCKTKRANPGQMDLQDIDKKVMLVSATPLNNRPEDIRNLILLFQDGRVTTLEAVPNITHFFSPHIEEYRRIKLEMAETRTPAERVPYLGRIQRIYADIRTKVVAPLMVRRTRADLLENEAYRKDLEAQQITFPKVPPPQKILYQLSPELEELYDNTMAALTSAIRFARYQAIGNLVPEKAVHFPQGKRISMSLAYIMKTMLVKRLDSSFTAFTATLGRYQQANRNMLRMFENGIVFIAPELKVNEMIEEGREEELLDQVEAIEQREGVERKFRPDDFVPQFHENLMADQRLLDRLVPAWQKVKEDPKLDAFIARIRHEFFRKDINREGKLVVFSEAADTTRYLAARLKEALAAEHNILSVSAGNRREAQADVKANFDANAKEQKNEYDIIITTEVLAEGVNLHRANVIVNYDTPWNSTRLMQRIGRVNRIGTRADTVHVYNFYPTAKVDTDIGLYNKALLKLQAFHTALGEDSQIYSEEEEFTSFGLFEKPIEDGERDERLQLLLYLRSFKETQPERFRRIARLPGRIRCGRTMGRERGATFCYLRNPHREDFLLVSPSQVQEISFLDAAHLLQCVETLSPQPLPPQHHEQVKAGLAFFDRALKEAVVDANAIVNKTKGPQETNALLLLRELLRIHYDTLTEPERALMQAGREAVDRGRFQALARELARLYKQQTGKKREAHLPPHQLLKLVLDQLRAYPLQTPTNAPPAEAPPKGAAGKPDIILSESFT